MIVTDYITQFIEMAGIEVAFGYPGGMVTFLMESFDKSNKVQAYCMYHEQAAAFAACGYAQRSGKVGVAYATSGPGATNLITGICHAFYESVPVIFITGQVNRNEAKGSLKVRQRGFQETDIVQMVKGITKYAAYVEEPDDIRYHLEKALFCAKEGRPGPVLLDIPIDVQRSTINENLVKKYEETKLLLHDIKEKADIVLNYLLDAKRPVLLLGNGIHTSGCHEMVKQLMCTMNIPVVTSMISIDILPKEHSNNYGFIGAYGTRYSNFIISKSDLVISFGSRLDIRQTGANKNEFAKNARIVRIDVDQYELENKIKLDEVPILADLKDILNELRNEQRFTKYTANRTWLDQCVYYKRKLLGIDDLIPNEIIAKISSYIPDNVTITTDVGQNQVWMAQSFVNQENQRVLFSGGHGAMGFSLPAAIGAYYSTKKPVYCFSGDGGIQINIQELQFIVREKIPIKIFIINNHSLGMIRHFQEIYFNSNFSQTVIEKGYSTPDFTKIGDAYGIRSFTIRSKEDLLELRSHFIDNEPLLINYIINGPTFVYPKLEFTRPIYDQDPPIDRSLLQELLDYEP